MNHSAAHDKQAKKKETFGGDGLGQDRVVWQNKSIILH